MDTTAQPLSQLVSLLGSSLALYVADAGIWTYPGSEEIKFALAELVDDHHSLLERAGAILEERGVPVPRHPYPIRFTATHDLDLRVLLPRIVAGLESQVVELERTAAAGGDAEGLGLVREAITSTRSHLNDLQQVLARPRAAAG
ncbi:MAG: hypothetical protein EBZ74_04915 [Planctomycetia bacterium]|nr:hypothetical protein [Planctomycetia bacterium]